MSVIWEVVASLALILLTVLADSIRESHLRRISTGESLADDPMKDSSVCKAYLTCLEGTT